MSGESAAERFIRENWDRSVSRDEPGSGFGGVDLPHPYSTASIPGEGRFSFFFYWDTYFTNVGLLAHGRLDVARGNIENMLWLIDRQGYMPNHVGVTNRSQPPWLCRMVQEYLSVAAVGRANGAGEATATRADASALPRDPDLRDFFRRAAEGVRREYHFFTTARMTACGLNGYGHHTSAADCISFYDRTLVRRLGMEAGINPARRAAIGGHFLGEAESGWDFCERFSGRCLHHAAVDLNALLYGHERFLARAGRLLGWSEAPAYDEAAERRRALAGELLWDDERGWFCDYDAHEQRPSPTRSLAGTVALFTGLATAEQAARMAATLADFEREHGVAVTPDSPTARRYQWAYPNVWPPMVFTTVAGLARYGHDDAARRIAQKFVATTDALFARTGMFWEKTDAETGEVAGGEYDAVPMLGWSAGVYVALRRYLAGAALPPAAW